MSHDRASGPLALESEQHFPMMAARTDFLSQVLTLIRLRGELVFSADLAAPWAISVPPRHAWFHAVTAGACRVEASDGKAVDLAAGDIVVLPQGSGHLIGTRGGQPMRGEELLEQLREGSLHVRPEGKGLATQLISGAFRFEGDNLPDMLAVLPSLIHIPHAATSDGDAAWLGGLAATLLTEATTHDPGAAIMISRLVDVLVIRAMRIWVRTAPPEDKGWLGALADPRISRALKAIHDEPFRRWTVAGLAAIAGMSRSSFADRFTTLIGAAPLHYQTRWRLLLANEMLKRLDTRVSDVARRVGYDSDAAFSRAFKAQFGFAPAMAKSAGGARTASNA
jgi:AraC-like DNA-binding protein